MPSDPATLPGRMPEVQSNIPEKDKA